MCETAIGLLIVAAVFYQMIRGKDAPARRPPQSWDDNSESPLGLVDDPEDEWIEWAMMDGTLDDDDF